MDEEFAEGGDEFADDGFDPSAPLEFPEELVDPLVRLVELGYLEGTHTAFGHEYGIRTLTTGEELRAMSLTKPWSEVPMAQGKAYATAMVAACLTDVDGEQTARGNRPGDDGLRGRWNYAQKLHWPVVESIYAGYTELEKEAKRVLEALHEVATEEEGAGSDETGAEGAL
jgi:hypothetical protein